jgi:hypothetical protein
VRLLLCLLLSAVAALGASVGDTYDQVLAEKGKPRNVIDAGAVRVLTYADVTVKLRDGVVVSVKPTPAQAPVPTTPPPAALEVKAVKAKLDDALAKVVAIINQPLPFLPRPPKERMRIGVFHDGATRPNFSTVDVRLTQDGMFDAEPFITWEGNTDKMWVGKDTEFNAMTKYFYLDRSLPKKKLSEDEMLEVNRLYRIIGECEKQLAALGYQGPVP